jgi:hypothetical protein
VSLDADELASALESIATEDDLPSRVDADRARSDGRRMLRHRRAGAGLGVTGAAAFTAVLALGANHVLGSGHTAIPAASGSASARPATVHTADWDPLIAPATFGWLPDNAQNVNYTVAPGFGQGPATLGKGSMVSDGTVGHDAAMIWLAMLAVDQAAPKAGPLNDGSGRILVSAGDVNGRAAFWAVDPSNRNPDQGKAGTLYFQSPAGRWAVVSAYYLGADPVATTLLEVARKAHIGDTPVPLPVRIAGLPATATGLVAEVDRPTTILGATWSVTLSFGVGVGTVSVNVYPGTATPAAGTSFGEHCRVSDSLRICVSNIGKLDTKLLPGGLDGLLRTITPLGPDPARWTTDVVVVEH